MIINFLCGIAIILFGTSAMSNSFEKICGHKIRTKIAKYKNSNFKNASFGTLLTVLLQSSTASVALIIGLCGVGIVGLLQAICLIIGSNIGSALNMLLLAFQEVNIISYLGLLLIIGVFFNLFFKNKTVKTWGLCISGLGLMFIGMSLMSSASNELSSDQGFVDFFFRINNPFWLFCLGLVLSALINSPIGTMAIISTILSSTPSILTLQNAVYVVYAMNIGTCIMLLFIGLSQNRRAFKASLSYLAFNIMGAIIFILLSMFDLVTPLASFLNNTTFQLIFINILFNIVTAVLFFPFAKLFKKLLDKILPENKEKITDQISLMPTLGIAQLSANALHYFNLTCDNLQASMEYVSTFENNDDDKLKLNLNKLILDTQDMNKHLLQLGDGLSQSEIDSKRDLNNTFIGIEKTNVNIIKLINSCKYNNIKVNFTQKQLKIILAIQELMKENLKDMKLIMEETIQQGGLKNSILLEQIIKRLEKIVKLKIRAKKNIIQDTVSLEQKIRKYTCFLNVINYFEQINTNLTDIILGSCNLNKVNN